MFEVLSGGTGGAVFISGPGRGGRVWAGNSFFERILVIKDIEMFIFDFGPPSLTPSHQTRTENQIFGKGPKNNVWAICHSPVKYADSGNREREWAREQQN